MSGTVEFEDWYREHAVRLVAVLGVVIADEDEARDAVAEACAKAFVRWGRVGRMANPAGWVYVVALRDVRRTRARRARPLPAPAPQHEGRSESDPAVWKAVQELPERMRLAVALRYVGDMNDVEVAAVMSISRGGAASLLHKARAALRTKLEMEVPDDDRR